MKCATKSASYVMELRLWDECLFGSRKIQGVQFLAIYYRNYWQNCEWFIYHIHSTSCR